MTEQSLADTMFGERKFKIFIDGVPVIVSLNHDTFAAERLELKYYHEPLQNDVYKELQKRKAAKISDKL